MKTNFRTFKLLSSFAITAGILTGCGGSGAAGSSVATTLAEAYTATIIPNPAGATSIEINAVNQKGDVVVGTYRVGGIRHVFKYENGSTIELSSGPEDLKPTLVTENGLILGSYDIGNKSHPFSISGTELSKPNLISDATDGWYVGYTDDDTAYISYEMLDGTYRAYKVGEGGPIQITKDGITDCGVSTVNPDGLLTGWYKEGGVFKFAKYDPKTNAWQDILTNSSNPSTNAINASGTFVGYEKVSGVMVPFIDMKGSHLTFWDSASNYASFRSVSTGNIAVGSTNLLVNGTYQYHAIGWSESTGLVDLTTRIVGSPDFLPRFAYAVDASGRIYGSGAQNGQSVAYILTPVKK